jgi:DNA polymerase-3 subunit beta
MRVSVLQDKLAKGLSIANRAVSSRPSMPVLGNVLLSTEEGRLSISANNLELGITARIGANVEAEGAITVPARTLLDLVNTLPPERVDLEVDPSTTTLTLRCNATVTNIKGIPATEFPAVVTDDDDVGIEVGAPVLESMIEQVAFAAAKEDNRPILMGVLVRFEDTRFTMIAADGFRMALRSTPLETAVSQPLSLIVPARTLSELGRIIAGDEGKVLISVSPNRSQVMFHLESADVVSQLIDGRFPDVEGLIPKSSATATTVQTLDLLLACRRSEIFARESNYTMRLRIEPGDGETGQVVVTAQAQERGDNEASLEALVRGGGLEISFNVRYLIDVLNVMDAEQVVIETNTVSQPGLIKPVGRDDFLYVVMPMSMR